MKTQKRRHVIWKWKVEYQEQKGPSWERRLENVGEGVKEGQTVTI